MLRIQENISLRPFNTFGIDVRARFFTEVFSEDDIHAIIHDEKLKVLPKLILGGGSNILFTQDFHGLVIKNNLHGINIIEETNEYALVEAASGETWHQFVLFCIEKNLGGI